MKRDAVVIGAGPVGLTAALLLERQGLRVALIEQRSTREPMLGAVALDDESLRIWQACGLSEEIEDDWASGQQGQVVCEYLDARGRPFIQIRRTDSDLGYPHAVCVDLTSIVAKLRQRVEKQTSVELYSGCTMRAITQHDSSVHIQCEHENGSAFELDADWCIACDGRTSKTRELLGIEMLGADLPEPWLVADFEDPTPSGWARFRCLPGRACVTVPLPHGHRRIERMLEPDAACEQILNDESQARSLLSPAWEHALQAPIRSMAVMRFHAGVAQRWRDGRVLLAGDAAHQTPPFAGQGLATGLRDVSNLCFKIAGVQRGWLREEVIETYENERRPHQQQMIDLALRLGRVMSPCSRGSAAITHTLIRMLTHIPPIHRALMLRGTQTRPILHSGFMMPGGLAGQSIPQPWVIINGSEHIRFDELLGPRMTWILTGIDRDAPHQSRSFLSSDDTLLVENRDFTDPERIFQRRYGKQSLVLVRPDRIVHTHTAASKVAQLPKRTSSWFNASTPYANPTQSGTR